MALAALVGEGVYNFGEVNAHRVLGALAGGPHAWLAELLLANGEYAAARNEVLKNYVPMAQTTGTLWELFEKHVSCNHGFTSFIAVLIDQLAEARG